MDSVSQEAEYVLDMHRLTSYVTYCWHGADGPDCWGCEREKSLSKKDRLLWRYDITLWQVSNRLRRKIVQRNL